MALNAQQQSPNTSYPLVSVIIPSKNRNTWVTELSMSIQELLRNTPHELIIIDDNSKEPLHISGRNTRIIRNDVTQGPSLSRNIGVQHAKGSWIIFVDDDCMVSTNWLPTVLQSITKNSTYDFIIGAVVYQDREASYPKRIVQNPRAYWPMSAHVVWKKESFERIGGFDSHFSEYHNEDTELAIRAISLGCRYTRDPSLQVVHRVSYLSAHDVIRSAKHVAVWPLLMTLYPKHYNEFRISQIGRILFPLEYIYILAYPLLFPIILFRYLLLNIHNPRGNFAMFFVKWPLLFILRRLHLWRAAIRHRVFVL